MYKIDLTLILIFFNLINCFSQREDNIWLFGTSSVNLTNYNGYAYGNTIIDFTDTEPQIYFDTTMTMDFGGGCTSICDKNGKLILYSNGMQVHNGNHEPIRGADTIAYSNFWESLNIKNYPFPGQDWVVGLRVFQTILALPSPKDSNEYDLFYYIGIDTSFFVTFDRFCHASFNNEKIKTYTNFKDSLIHKNVFIGGTINACRHANGRDWWIVNRSIDRQFLFLYLYDINGIQLFRKIKIENPYTIDSEKLGQLYFSPDGKMMAISESIIWPFDSLYISLYNFDRVNGVIEPIFFDTLKNYRVHGTLAFSPDSKFMYASNHIELFQYDVQASGIKNSKKKIGQFDGYKFKYNEFDDGTETELGGMAHGPDGRIYIVPESSNRFLHTIEFPEEEGLDAKLIQRKIMLPTSNHVTVPNFPHYRLGPLDGSPADTLGLDNHPIAKFRFEQDTSNHLRVRFTDLSYFRPETWHWDFSDGTTFEGKKPYWHQFPKNGTYNVCLTVSNENSENTMCR